MISINGLSVRIDENPESSYIIKNLNMFVRPNESFSVIGPSGCGKTTLLHVIAGIREGYSGEIERDYQMLDQALVLQDIGLLPWKTVWENAVLGLKLQGGKDFDTARVLLDRLGLSEMRDRFPAQLSGGQQRRLGLVRSLAVKPKVLLMDEPLVSLDEFTRESLQDEILDLWKGSDLTMVMVTHNLEEAIFLGERVGVLTSQPASMKGLLENPGMGQVDYRRSEEFYEKIKKLREYFS